MRFWKLLFLVGMMSVAGAQDAGDDNAFAKANSAYTQENYQEAVDKYQSILQSGQHSGELYFNLANSHYKLNEVGPAVYFFEKALQLDPSNKEYQNNLKFAQQLRVDAVEQGQTNPVSDFVYGVFQSLSVDNWAYVSIMLALLAILAFILYHYAATASKKRLFFIVSVVLFIGFVFAVIAASYSQSWSQNNQEAIVYSSETITRTEPKSTATSSFAIHEGTKVTIVEEYADWAKIEVANGSQSWMPLADLKKL